MSFKTIASRKNVKDSNLLQMYRKLIPRTIHMEAALPAGWADFHQRVLDEEMEEERMS